MSGSTATGGQSLPTNHPNQDQQKPAPTPGTDVGASMSTDTKPESAFSVDKANSPTMSADSPPAGNVLGKGDARGLAASLGFNSWPYSDEALVKALEAKAEHEKTKQEFFRLESHKKVIEIFQRAEVLGVPGYAIPKLFGINDNLASTAFVNYTKGHGPIDRTMQSSTPVSAAEPHSRSQSQSQLQVNTSQQPYKSQQYVTSMPHTPARGSHNATLASPAGHAPMPSQDYSTFSSMSASSVNSSHSHLLDASNLSQARREGPEKFAPGHRSTVSALPSFGTNSPQVYAPPPASVMSTPGRLVVSGGYYPPPQQLVSPGGMRMPGQQSSASQYSPIKMQLGPGGVPQLLPSGVPDLQNDYTRHTPQGSPQQIPYGMPASSSHPGSSVVSPIAPGSVPSYIPITNAHSRSSSNVSQSSSVSNHYQQQHQHHEGDTTAMQQPRVPVIGMTPAGGDRPPRRSHQQSFSAGSDLQIHQWKPKQLLRDNRWKLADAYKVRERRGRVEEAAARAEGAEAVAQDAFVAGRASVKHTTTDPQSPQHLERNPSASSTPSSSSAAVVAAHNSRRRSATHVRRRSAAAYGGEGVAPSHTGDQDRRSEGIATLASLAFEQDRRNVAAGRPLGPVRSASNDEPGPVLDDNASSQGGPGPIMPTHPSTPPS